MEPLSQTLRPLLRPLEMIPVGSGEERMYVLRDPEGYGRLVAVPGAVALIALLMDGRRTLGEIRAAFEQQVGSPVEDQELEHILDKLDAAYLLVGKRFDRRRQRVLAKYVKCPVRPAFNAGGAYPDKPRELRAQLDEYFTGDDGPGAIRGARNGGRELRGLVSPHIDLYRGGTTYAWGYKRLAEESSAEVFVIFGTSHYPLTQPFSVSRKDYATPLGVMPTAGAFVDRLAQNLETSVVGRQMNLFADELAHRTEHSIEFQAVLLRYALGDRPVSIVPVLVNSFYENIENRQQPDERPEVQEFLAALRAAEAAHAGRVCYIGSADLAHIGQHFGDDDLLDDERLKQQGVDDRRLLERAAAGDAAGFFDHVACQNDRNRVCGLSPGYMLLQAIQPARGEVLHYDQAVESDRTACVSFASMAFYAAEA